MSLEIISKDIFSRAEEKIKLLENEKSNNLKEFKAQTEKEIEKFKAKLQSTLDEEVKLYKESIFGNYQREGKKVVLSSKLEVIKDLYDTAYNELINMSISDKKVLFKKQIAIAKKELDLGFVITSKSDSEIVKPLLDKEIIIKIDNNVEGLKFESKDSKQLLNLSFKAILDDFFNENNEEIQDNLFKGAKI